MVSGRGCDALGPTARRPARARLMRTTAGKNWQMNMNKTAAKAAKVARREWWGQHVPSVAWEDATVTRLADVRDRLEPVDTPRGADIIHRLPDATPVVVADGWVVWDDTRAVMWTAAASAAEAAAEYVEGAEWGDRLSDWRWEGRAARYCVVLGRRRHLIALLDEQPVSVVVPADEPDCTDPEGHDWQSPHAVVGGLKENPGVWSSGATLHVTEVCTRCGWYRTREVHTADGWSRTRYTPPDHVSTAYVAATQQEAQQEAP